jgi:membrane protein
MKFLKKTGNYLEFIFSSTSEENNLGLTDDSHFITKFIRKLVKFINTLDSHNIFMLSAGIAFNIFIYFIPLLLIAIYIGINLVETTVIDNTIQTLFLEFLPNSENTFVIIYEVLTEISTIQKGSSTSGLIGIISLLWISSLFISAIRSGLDRVLEVKAKRVFIFYRLKDILLTLFFPILIIFYSLAIPLLAIATKYFAEFIPFLKTKAITDWIAEFFSFFFSLILFYLIYKFIPSMKISNRFALLTAFIGGVLVFIARWIFSWYLVSISNYGAFYGAYAAIVAIAIWVYYFSFILLFSAEVGSLISSRKTVIKQ